MKYFFIIMIMAAILLVACSESEFSGEMKDEASMEVGGTTVDVLGSDFTLAEGAAKGPGEHGPWDMRLVLATSEDSVNWEKTGLILADQGDVPSLVYDAEGRLLLYYVTWAEEVRNQIVVAVSEDEGQKWSFKGVEVPSSKGWSNVVDPSVVLLENGTLRMYATLDKGEGDGPATHSFISEDGIHFELEEGVRFDAKAPVLDPNVILIDGVWHLYAGGEGSKNYHAIAKDGLTFEQQDSIALKNMMFSNGIVVEGGVRYYGFEFAVDDAIYSLFSEDGYIWELENEVLILEENNVEHRAVKDATVLQRKDGSYLMVYVTGIEE